MINFCWLVYCFSCPCLNSQGNKGQHCRPCALVYTGPLALQTPSVASWWKQISAYIQLQDQGWNRNYQTHPSWKIAPVISPNYPPHPQSFLLLLQVAPQINDMRLILISTCGLLFWTVNWNLDIPSGLTFGWGRLKLLNFLRKSMNIFLLIIILFLQLLLRMSLLCLSNPSILPRVLKFLLSSMFIDFPSQLLNPNILYS